MPCSCSTFTKASSVVIRMLALPLRPAILAAAHGRSQHPAGEAVATQFKNPRMR